jgi:hypothetical protein
MVVVGEEARRGGRESDASRLGRATLRLFPFSDLPPRFACSSPSQLHSSQPVTEMSHALGRSTAGCDLLQAVYWLPAYLLPAQLYNSRSMHSATASCCEPCFVLYKTADSQLDKQPAPQTRMHLLKPHIFVCAALLILMVALSCGLGSCTATFGSEAWRTRHRNSGNCVGAQELDASSHGVLQQQQAHDQPPAPPEQVVYEEDVVVSDF